MNVTEQNEAEPEASAATHSWIISDLRNATALGRLGMGEIRHMLARLQDRGYAITEMPSPDAAKAQHGALPDKAPDAKPAAAND